jgi:ribosomal protein L7/L12
MFLMFLGMKKQLARLAHVDAKVNLLMEHAGIKFGPLATMPREAADALKRSDKIEAIRLYRANTGASLVEAKQVVEAAHA